MRLWAKTTFAVLIAIVVALSDARGACVGNSAAASAVDEIAISNLMAEYSARLESRNWEAFGCLFLHGAFLDSKGQVLARGSAAVASLVEGTLGKQPTTLLVRRIFTNPKITIDRNAGTASAQSYLTTIYIEPGKAPHFHRLATYVDSFRKIDGQWWFVTRQELTAWAEE